MENFRYTLEEYQNLYRDTASGDLVSDGFEQQLVLLLQRSQRKATPVFDESTVTLIDYNEEIEREIDGDGFNSAIYELVYACAVVSEGHCVSVVDWWSPSTTTDPSMLAFVMLRVLNERNQVDAVYIWALVYLCEFTVFYQGANGLVTRSMYETVSVLARTTLPKYVDSLITYVTDTMREAIAYNATEEDAVNELLMSCQQMRDNYLSTIFDEEGRQHRHDVVTAASSTRAQPEKEDDDAMFDNLYVSDYDSFDRLPPQTFHSDFERHGWYDDGKTACCAPPLPGDRDEVPYEYGSMDMLSDYVRNTHITTDYGDDGDGD
jgi:hypothetical protein